MMTSRTKTPRPNWKSSSWHRVFSVALLLTVLRAVRPWSAAAQEGGGCAVLCAPDLALEPTIPFENIAARHRIANVQGSQPVDTTRAHIEGVFETILSLGIPREIPRVELTLEAIWAPFAGTDANVFTGRSADDLGVEGVRDNPVELEGELNVALVTFEETGGWLDAHFDIVDQFSPWRRPPPRRRTRTSSTWSSTSLSRPSSCREPVTGIPRAGDRLGDELYLDDASPWGFSVLLVLPPLAG